MTYKIRQNFSSKFERYILLYIHTAKKSLFFMKGPLTLIWPTKFDRTFRVSSKHIYIVYVLASKKSQFKKKLLWPWPDLTHRVNLFLLIRNIYTFIWIERKKITMSLENIFDLDLTWLNRLIFLRWFEIYPYCMTSGSYLAYGHLELYPLISHELRLGSTCANGDYCSTRGDLPVYRVSKKSKFSAKLPMEVANVLYKSQKWWKSTQLYLSIKNRTKF